MADNVTLPGTGATIASDDVDGVQYQIIKIAIGSDGSATLLPGEGTYGVDVDVTRLPALPAGTNNIGDVDVASVIPGTGATNLAKSAFTGHPTGAVGVPVFGEKAASLTDWSGEADGTYLPLFQDSDGRLYVNASLTVDGDGANATTKMMGSDYDGGWHPLLVDMNGVIAVNLNNAPVIERTGIMRDASLVTVTPKYAVISASSSGNNTIVAAVSDKKIRVLSVSLSASAAVNAKFQSAAGGTDITGLYYLAANGGMVLPHNIHGWFETAASALLNLNLSGAVAVGGSITYIEV